MDDLTNEPTIGGMTYETYDSGRDPSGAIGIALADAHVQEEKLEAMIADAELSQRARCYDAFLEAGFNTSSAPWMRQALVTHFPHQFGPGKQQDVSDYDSRRLFGVYMGMRRTALRFFEKKTGRTKR
jgi:hypothetical protein